MVKKNLKGMIIMSNKYFYCSVLKEILELIQGVSETILF